MLHLVITFFENIIKGSKRGNEQICQSFEILFTKNYFPIYIKVAYTHDNIILIKNCSTLNAVI